MRVVRGVMGGVGVAVFVMGGGACDSGSAPRSMVVEGGADAGPDVSLDGGVDAADGEAGSRPVAGGSGAFAIVNVGAVQKMYLPLPISGANGHGLLAVVDVGVVGDGAAGSPALIIEVDLGSADVASTTAGDDALVIAAATDNRKVWFVDPKADAVLKTIELDASYGRSGFSGGGGYVTGIALDRAHQRAILSVWNGFAIVDLQTLSVTRGIEAPPSENFGFDAVRQRIVAPFYECATSSNGAGPPPFCSDYKAPDGKPMTDGLTVIDLTDDTVYLWQDPLATDPHTPLGSEPDSAAVDPSTGVAVIPSELGNFQNVIDLGGSAVFDRATKTVTAKRTTIDTQGFEGVAIDSVRHLAFFEEEASDAIAIADLTTLGTPAPQVVAHLPQRPSPPRAWTNLGDPHGVAVTTSLADGRSVGLVVDTARKWVARVDLAKLLGLANAAPGQTSLTAAQTAPAVTMLDARTKR